MLYSIRLERYARDKHTSLLGLFHKLRRKWSVLKMKPEAIVIKLFTAVSYDFSLKARVFVPGKPFQSSLMLAVRPGAYPRVEQLHLGWLWLYPQTLD